MERQREEIHTRGMKRTGMVGERRSMTRARSLKISATNLQQGNMAFNKGCKTQLRAELRTSVGMSLRPPRFGVGVETASLQPSK